MAFKLYGMEVGNTRPLAFLSGITINNLITYKCLMLYLHIGNTRWCNSSSDHHIFLALNKIIAFKIREYLILKNKIKIVLFIYNYGELN